MNHFYHQNILIKGFSSFDRLMMRKQFDLGSCIGWMVDASWEWKGGISDGPLLAGSEDPGVPVPLMQWMALPGLKLWGRWWGGYWKVRGAKHVKMPPALRSQKPIYVLPIQGNVSYLVGGNKSVPNTYSGVCLTVCKEITNKFTQQYDHPESKSKLKYVSSETSSCRHLKFRPSNQQSQNWDIFFSAQYSKLNFLGFVGKQTKQCS